MAPFVLRNRLLQPRTIMKRRQNHFATLALTCATLCLAAHGYSQPNMRALRHFAGGTDGAAPWATVIQGADGMLYGTTSQGGRGSGYLDGFGTVFKVNTNGDGYTVLHRFTLYDGDTPRSTLVQGTDGMLYGTTQYGGWDSGYRQGTIFKLSTSGDNFQVLHRF